MREETGTFLAALFDAKPDPTRILIWTLPDRASRFCKSVDEAAADAVRLASENKDVYFGCGLAKRAVEFGRGTIGNIAAIPGVWVDFDIRGAGHKDTKKTLAPNVDAVENVLQKLVIEPSIVVHTGGGVHCYWLFKELWTFADDKAREDAQKFCLSWVRTVQSVAKSAGYDVDSTFDISRVLRVPGTFNFKSGSPVPVRILRMNENRYDPSEIEPFIMPDAVNASPMKAPVSLETLARVSGSGLILDPNASPMIDKLEALAEAEPRFRQSWERKRRDLSDQSASSYDLSLATHAAMAGWTDQEIVNLLIASRRKFKDDLKLRVDYYVRTLARARTITSRGKAVEELKHANAKPPASENGDGDPSHSPTTESRDGLLKYLSDAFGTKIVRIVKYVQDPPRYRLITAKGGIDLGGVENLISQTSLRNALAASDGHYIPKFKNDDWDSMAQTLLDCCDLEYTGEESTDVGQMKSWLRRYVEENPPGELDAATIANQTPLFPQTEDSVVYIFLSHFREWLFRRENEKLSAKAAGITLRRIGAEPIVIAYKDDRTPDRPKESTRNVWALKYDRDSETLFPRVVRAIDDKDNPLPPAKEESAKQS